MRRTAHWIHGKSYSFRGRKASLFGDAHAYGPDGVASCAPGKVVTSRWPAPTSGGVGPDFPQNA